MLNLTHLMQLLGAHRVERDMIMVADTMRLPDLIHAYKRRMLIDTVMKAVSVGKATFPQWAQQGARMQAQRRSGCQVRVGRFGAVQSVS